MCKEISEPFHQCDSSEFFSNKYRKEGI